MVQIRENLSLKVFNTFGIDVDAQYFSSFNNLDDLRELLSYIKERKIQQSLVLGGGSNILLLKDYEGLVLKNEMKGIEMINEDADFIYIKVGAGENWHQFVMHCVQHNYTGVENLSLIPGNVGASPMQNIGAYGVEIKDVFYQLKAMHIQEQEIHTFTLEDCHFGYRESVFKNKVKGQYVITSVTYRLNKTPRYNTSYGAIKQELEKMGVTELSIQAISQAVINIRSSKLPNPAEIGNAGSFFKNPQIPIADFNKLKETYPSIVGFPVNENFTKVAAGWLIEQCGWKGYRKGDAGCYPKQALVLVNYGTARGSEIFQLSEEIIESVKTKFAVVLEREVNVV
jgi:UDP-N-acetylmuramate dehydrogenase